MAFQISFCHRSRNIVNQNEWYFTRMGGGGGILKSASLLEN